MKCLELLDIVDAICQSNGINYSLCGGSVVGAHLYGGCLPWDDDVDLMMTRDNYNRFIEAAKKSLPDGLSMHNYQTGDDFTTLFTKIMDDNTTIVQQDGTVSGVFLDITVYDKIPCNLLSKIDVLLWMISQWVAIGKVKPTRLKQRMRNILLSTPLADKRRYFKFFEWAVCWLGKHCKRYDYSELFGAFANTTRFAPKIFENYATIPFEGKQYMIVRDYVDYLRTRYNRTDFREPKDKQIAPHYRYVNFNFPYKSYINSRKISKSRSCYDVY